MTDYADSDHTRRTKTVLFCAVCGHESPADGDWDESTTARGPGEADRRLVLSCPDCGATVARRPVSESTRMATTVADD